MSFLRGKRNTYYFTLTRPQFLAMIEVASRGLELQSQVWVNRTGVSRPSLDARCAVSILAALAGETILDNTSFTSEIHGTMKGFS